MRLIGLVLALGLVLAPLAVEAQPAGKVWRIGVLSTVPSPPSDAAALQSLREHGYVEGRNLVVEWRFSEGEEAFERMLLERAEQLRKHHGPALGGYAKSHAQTIDTAQTRAAMRALGIGKVVVTPTSEGWTFAGDGNLSGLVSGGATRESRRSPRLPPTGHSAVPHDRLRRRSRRSSGDSADYNPGSGNFGESEGGW